jgi:hypothetical protein
LAGCIGSEPRPLIRPAPAAFSAFAHELAKFRRLPLKREITLATGPDLLPPNDATAAFALKQIEHIYQSIGLIEPDTDLAAALGEFRRLDQLSAYDRNNGEITLASAAAKLGAPFEMTEPNLARDAPLAMAVVTALQEQNFFWLERSRSVLLEDQQLAWRALATGDAVVALIAHAANRTDLNASDLARASRFAAELEKSAARLPAFLRGKIAFPYRDGSRFVFWALKAKGWPGVDALYARPPISTAELLDPAKYYIAAERPLRFFPAALLSRARQTLALEQSLGAQLIRDLVADEIDAKPALDLAAAWRGDQLFALRDGNEIATAWYSAWSSPEQAATFQRAYRNILQRRQRIRFDGPSTSQWQAAPHTFLSGRTRTNRGVMLETRDSVVLWLTGVPLERLDEWVEFAWRDVEIEADPTAIRFDSVRAAPGRRQESLNGR